MFSNNAQGGDYMSNCHHLTYIWLIPKECTYNISYERMQSRHLSQYIKSVIRKHILNGVVITRYQIGNQKTYIKRSRNHKISNR
jgi:hypothetical protein